MCAWVSEGLRDGATVSELDGLSIVHHGRNLLSISNPFVSDDCLWGSEGEGMDWPPALKWRAQITNMSYPRKWIVD